MQMIRLNFILKPEAATRGVLCKKVFLECNFIKKETLAQVFSCEFCEISKNTFFTEHVWATASIKSVCMSVMLHIQRNFVLESAKYSKTIFLLYRSFIRKVSGQSPSSKIAPGPGQDWGLGQSQGQFQGWGETRQQPRRKIAPQLGLRVE